MLNTTHQTALQGYSGSSDAMKVTLHGILCRRTGAALYTSRLET